MPSLRDFLIQGQDKLSLGPHPDRAKQDAELLLRHLEGFSRAWIVANPDAELNASTWNSYCALLQRRFHGEPIQYITGLSEFLGLPFAVTRDVLIPRPETEHLVEEVLRFAQGINHLRIADIGTGSGAIAVALAHSLPQARITATDLSPQALAIAQGNAERNQVADRIAFLEGDLLTPLAGQTFQIIASNPPYIPLTDLDTLSVEVRDYEPHQALFAGRDGLDIYKRLIPDARQLLAPGGWLATEIGYGQQPAIEQLLRENGYGEFHFLPDYQGIPRVACGQLR